ncbi:virulence protein [Bilifractor sp. HCP3S3_D3]|uniref:virulence protein n=1 Tax=Bilifractor sp. HCP3S3_D3 TaxID=3438907 RepID=UPI003F8A0520
MKANYNLTGTKRKELVNAIAEITGEKADYKRMPTCAYEIGDITVDKDGSVTCEDEEKLKKVMEALNEKGFTAEGEQEDGKAEQPEQVATTEKENATGQEPALTISLPLASANIDTLKNLISAKESLIKKALGITDTQINITDDKIEFPWFDRELTSEEVNAYTRFLSFLCKLSKEVNRCSGKEHPAVNEKYTFRCFLLRLGFIGAEYKEDRKVLLKNLTGSSAFKNGAPAKEVLS